MNVTFVRSCMSWLDKLTDKKNKMNVHRASIPKGVWTQCPSCKQILYLMALRKNLAVCMKCNHHMRMSARQRLDSFLDKSDRIEIAKELEPKDLLIHRI